MNHWPFIIACYVIGIGGTAGVLLWSYIAMRRAEAQAEAITRK
ncbi:hypothetical protein [Sphingomonas quercus]|nr:hypothetical protein [Sphingomonas quercus]